MLALAKCSRIDFTRLRNFDLVRGSVILARSLANTEPVSYFLSTLRLCRSWRICFIVTLGAVVSTAATDFFLGLAIVIYYP